MYLGSFRLFKLHEGVAARFASEGINLIRVFYHTNGSEGGEGLGDVLLLGVVVDTANEDGAHHVDGLLSLEILGLLLLMG